MSKELYRNVILILDNLPQKGIIYERKDGVKLLGNSILWDEAHKWISHNVSHRIIFPGTSTLSVQKPEGIEIVRQRLINAIAEIEREEYVAELQIKESKSNIRSNHHSVIVAYIALVISILATTPLPERLYKWIAGLIHGLF